MKRLYRDKTDYKIAGICSGFGEYLNIDPVIIRLVFLFGLLLGGGLLVYIIAWFVIPIKEQL